MTATASSNKIDMDALNDSDTVNIDSETVATETEEDTILRVTCSSGGGGCSIAAGSQRTHIDPSQLILLFIASGMLLRRKNQLDK